MHLHCIIVNEPWTLAGCTFVDFPLGKVRYWLSGSITLGGPRSRARGPGIACGKLSFLRVVGGRDQFEDWLMCDVHRS